MFRNHTTDFIKSNSNGDPTIEKHDLKPISSICSNNILECREMIKVAVGLKNMGNTCFLNSTLQCLMHTAPLFNFLQSHAHEKSCNLKKFCMVCELKQLVKNCFNNGASSVAPQGILRNLKSIAGHLRWGRQEDAHEFLRYVIDAIHKSSPDLKKHSVKKPPSVAEKIFQGDLESQIKCLQCQHVSIKCDPFLDVCIDVKNVSSIESGLQKFTAPETLQGENSYMCSNCKKKVKATKMFRLRRLPRVFTVQLKRYSPFGGKVSKHVSFPEVLDLAPYATKKANGLLAEYELYAVLVHEGGSTKSGHYYCHVRGPGSKWFCMNDCHVSSISLQHVLRSQAYILFYVQKSNYLEKTCATEKAFLNGVKMNASVLNKNMIPLEPKLKKSLSMECLPIKDSIINKSMHLEHLQSKEMENKIVPQNTLSASPVLENGIVENGRSSKHEERSVDDGVSPRKSPKGEVNEVRSTTTWKVVEIGHNHGKQVCGNKKFRSTCTWNVVDYEVKAEIVPNSFENGFQCPTFDWDSKRHEVINKPKEDDKVSEELSNKRLTFGRPILTWNGEKSLLDSTENEDEFVSGRKRKWEEMDAEIDRGKERKFKKKRHSRDISDAFRIHADRSYSKNCENGLHQVL